jgi:photosystem II stability/assembly factor-like uncharacterized protein
MIRASIAILLSLCCSATFAAEHDHHDHASTTAPASAGVVSLDIYPTTGGPQLHLLTATGSPAHLIYQRSDDAGQTWSAPVPVGENQPPPSPIHRGMDAQLAASPDGTHLLAAWTTAGASDRFGRGPIATAYSADSGHTWTPGPNPADDGLATGHAFLDLACDAKGSFHLVWLDGRDNATGKGLRYARSDDGGHSWTRNQTLDPQTCECCWNTLVAAPDGRLLLLYRNCDPRDMSLLTSPDGGHAWSPDPTPVGPFHWEATVCPHVGGGLSLGANHTLFATVWTGAGDQAGGYLLTSPDAGHTWATPTRLGTGLRAWHTDVAADPATGRVTAVWDARTDTTPAIFAITSSDNGRTWSTPRRLTPPGTTATHPRVVPTPAGFRALWTQSTDANPTSVWTSVQLSE